MTIQKIIRKYGIVIAGAHILAIFGLFNDYTRSISVLIILVSILTIYVPMDDDNH